MAKKLTLWLLGVFLLTAGNAWAEDIVVVVNTNAPVQSLSANQIRNIYLGDSRRWGSVRIAPVDNQSSAALQGEFLNAVLHMDMGAYNSYWIKRAFRDGLMRPSVMKSSEAALRAVAGDKGGIGFFYASDASGATGVREVYRIR